MEDNWISESACLRDGVPLNFFFPVVVPGRHGANTPEHKRNLEGAQQVAARYCNEHCSVTERCLQANLYENKEGVYGGKTELERWLIRKRVARANSLGEVLAG